jgi:hypothetical protein
LILGLCRNALLDLLRALSLSEGILVSVSGSALAKRVEPHFIAAMTRHEVGAMVDLATINPLTPMPTGRRLERILMDHSSPPERTTDR